MSTYVDDSDDERQCYYCGCNVRKGWGAGEKDHFPIPKAAGGTAMVWSCCSCHDMKDRFPLDKWPIEWWGAVIESFPKLNRETRIFLAKAIALFYHTQHKDDTERTAVLEQWRNEEADKRAA